MLRTIIKCFAILSGVELLLFLGLIATSMSDDKPAAIADYFYWVLKYPLGFPLVLLNGEYPYFLDHGGKAIEAILLGALNDIILASILGVTFRACKRLLHE
jgi:hypothetical protein